MAVASLATRPKSGLALYIQPDVDPDRQAISGVMEHGLALLDDILNRLREWRRDVASGAIEFDNSTDMGLKDQLIDWLNTASRQVMPRIERLEKALDSTIRDESGRFRERVYKAQMMLDSWHKPTLTTTRALKSWRMSPEAFEKINDIVAGGTAKLKIQPTILS